MYAIVQKKSKKDDSYLRDEDLFFQTPQKMKKNTLRLLVSQKIVVSLSKDMEEMTKRMADFILEGMLDDRR